MINKIKWIAGISIIFFLILATNYVDRNDFQRIQDTMQTIYEDRIVAQDYVMELFMIYHEKALVNADASTSFNKGRNDLLNKNMQDYITKFATTRLTVKEQNLFDELVLRFDNVKKVEQSFGESISVADRQAYTSVLIDLQKSLFDLSKIQVEEGRRQLYIGKKAIYSIELLKKIEVYFLILLAVIVQLLILYKPKQKQQPNPINSPL